MEVEKPRIARLTAIITLLQSKKMITAREIAKKHQVSIRTVYRDIKTLQLSGIPIYTIEGRGYTIVDGYFLPPVMFSEKEANALITVEKIIHRNKDKSLIEHYGKAIDKIKSVLRKSELAKIELLGQRLEVRNYDDKTDSSQNLMQLQSAITMYSLVKLSYLSSENSFSERIIEPFAIYHTAENWVLIAFCRLRNDFRTFRLDRIQKLHLTTDHFEPHQLSLQEYLTEVRKKWNP